ncbi:hypothetical protein WM04_13505 [Burkholderia ubonensis]|uniref:CIS tube protein n=1 Tax=Burkholderia ubonensis TaxID=101571 RepID=UPI00076D590D|nr:hypothetical protein [Burkholderia ubonensis]KWI32625.1 hypothetical protein WM04_13505 [Burkholderia ubonensis]
MNISERSLSKLTIRGYSDREMSNFAGAVVAMFNPDSLRLSYRTQYTPNYFINSDAQSNAYLSSRPGALELELILDARMPGNRRPLEAQLTELHELCYAVEPVSSEPHFLSVSWGKLPMGGAAGGDFAGRCTDFSISYTLFDRDGTPLRATVSLSLTADASLILQNAKANQKSPSVTMLSVPDESSLALIAALLGASLKGGIDYLTLADSNDLDSLHAIEPGQTLVAPVQGGQ